MIASKAGREFIRSVNDDLPYMQKTLFVDIVSGSNRNTSEAIDNTLLDISNFLQNHGIKSSHESINAGNLPIGDMLLNNICE